MTSKPRPIVKQENASSSVVKRKRDASAPTKESVVMDTIALTHKLLDAEIEEKAAKKKKILSKLKNSSESERRAAIEKGRIKFVHQELRESNLKKIVANNCIIVGDDNNVLGNDNVLIGKNNKAVGENNKIVVPGTTTIVPQTAGAATSTATTTPAAAAVQTPISRSAPPVQQQQQEDSYYSEEFLTLPDNWIQFNGVIIYRDEDINAILKWIQKDWTIASGRQRGAPAYTAGASTQRFFSITEVVYAFMPAEILGIAARYNIPPKDNSVASAQIRGQAIAFGKIPMPPGMPPSTRAPKPQSSTITMPDFDRPPPQQTPASSSNRTPISNVQFSLPEGEEDDEVEQQQQQRPAATNSSSNKSKKPNFLPQAGVNPDNSNWKCSLLDLPGTADVAGRDEPTCKICLVNRMDVLFEPCHMMASCRDCAKELYKANPDNPLCPICRKKIEYGTIIFFD